ncbi:MAG: hypothetical protein NXI31_24750 [bacterium]|nr:hypothetical protein [bacterium]
MTADPAVAAPQPAAIAESKTERWSRLSDWLNPIVVREVQQALKGKVFVLSVIAACIVVVTIALVVASDFDPGSSGRNAFDAGLATLVPLLIFVVPMQAYQSMRHELKAGMVEQLLLSELRPRRIITGKLSAAMVQFVLYVSVLSPLLATSYLLRGVDMPTIGVSLLLALLFCVAATAFAVSSAAQGMNPSMQGVANLAVAVALALACMGLIGYVGSGEYARDIGWLLGSAELGMVLSGLALAGAASCTMSGLTAASFLAHAYENKSSGFRAFLLAFIVVTTLWVAFFVPVGGRDQVFVVATIAMMLGTAAFGVFMVTEQGALSPRVRAHVSRQPILALLSAPFLPGRHRGLLCYLVAVGLLAGLAWLTWPATGFAREPRGFAELLVAYTVIYLSIGCWLRGRLPSTLQGNHLARFALPFLLFLFCIVPVLIDVFVKGEVRSWHPGHIMNPFWTIERFAFRNSHGDTRMVVILIAAGFLLLQLRGIFGGIREVLGASARRRDLAPTTVAASASATAPVDATASPNATGPVDGTSESARDGD